jgi:hypothetical protein
MAVRDQVSGMFLQPDFILSAYAHCFELPFFEEVENAVKLIIGN